MDSSRISRSITDQNQPGNPKQAWRETSQNEPNASPMDGVEATDFPNAEMHPPVASRAHAAAAPIETSRTRRTTKIARHCTAYGSRNQKPSPESGMIRPMGHPIETLAPDGRRVLIYAYVPKTEQRRGARTTDPAVEAAIKGLHESGRTPPPAQQGPGLGKQPRPGPTEPKRVTVKSLGNNPTRSHRDRNQRRALAAVWWSTPKCVAIRLTRAPRSCIAPLTAPMTW